MRWDGEDFLLAGFCLFVFSLLAVGAIGAYLEFDLRRDCLEANAYDSKKCEELND